MKEYYRQCTLKQGNVSTTAWVPEEGAEVGKSFLFKDDREAGRWEVTHVGPSRILREEVKRSNVFDSIKPKLKT